MSAHMEDLKAKLAKLRGKPSGTVDTAKLKAQVHEDLEGFAIELFKENPGGYTNVKGTYFYLPEKLGKMSLETGAVFNDGGELLKLKEEGTTDVFDYWMHFKNATFAETLRDIKRWLSTSGSDAERKARKLRKLQDDEELKRMFGEVIFKDAPDVITDSASGILKRLPGGTGLTVKAFTALLREWEKDNSRAFSWGHLIVIEKPIGKLRGSKGGKSKFTLIRAKSELAREWMTKNVPGF